VGLVALGLDALGYDFVAVDCGWRAHDRDAGSRLQWNETLFPSGTQGTRRAIAWVGAGVGTVFWGRVFAVWEPGFADELGI
jgi:alpha-galactosidase